MSHKRAKKLRKALANERGIDVKEIVDHGKGEGRCPDSGRSIYRKTKAFLGQMMRSGFKFK